MERNPALFALGQQIRKVRQERGTSQEDFATGPGLGRSYYGGMERGDSSIVALNLMRIAVALGVEVGELFTKAQFLGDLVDSFTDKATGKQ